MAEVLGIILARGGSKSLPKKSIFPCAGKPLLYYTAKAAQGAKTITRLIISTDDEEIARVARSYGVETPFMRPAELAEDNTPDIPVIRHALRWLKDNEEYEPDVVVHLRPTTPLKASKDIDKGVKMLLADSDAEAVRSVCKPLHTPFKMYRQEAGEKYLKPLLASVYPDVFKKYPEAFNLPRQLFPEALRHTGYVDVLRPLLVMDEGSHLRRTKSIPLEIEEWRDVDIDSLKEIKYAEFLIQSLAEKGKEPWQS